jgi:microcystin-dependent protein
MDRQTIYAGQIPLETDQLKQSQNAMVGLAKLSAAVLGTSTIVNGFTVTPTVPASLNVIVTPGEVYQLENLEQSAWSSLGTDTHTILKQGIILDPVTFGIVPPNTVGYSQSFLVEAQYQDVDSGSTVLPYFNASNPTIPFSGPGNAGTAQNTVRKGVAALQVKAGIAAATGAQTTPTADAGWTGLFVVTVANGASTITSGNITPVKNAPFLPVTLPNVPAGVQSGQWLYGVDTGGVNAMVADVTPIPSQLLPGMTVHIRAAATNTGAVTLNLNGLGASSIHRANGAALSAGDINAGMLVQLIWDGSSWQIANYFGFTSSTVNNNTYTLSIPYAADSGTANSIVAAFSPAITALSAGQEIVVKLANTNTGATGISVNGLAAVSVVNPDGSALNAGQIVAGEMLWLLYDGTRFQACNPHTTGPGTVPVGGMVMWLDDALPADGSWCWANGGTLSRTGNGAALFALWGARYGAGDGATTFNVINMQEVVPVGTSGMGGAASPGLLASIAVGVKNVLGSLFGTDTTTLTAAEIPPVAFSGTTGNDAPDHTHAVSGPMESIGQTVPQSGGAGQSGVPASFGTGGASTRHQHPFSGAIEGGGQAHTNVQPSRAVSYIIRIA